MQTPGRRVESLTPMIAINRRVNTVFERLTKVEEDIVEIERPQRRMFGRILSQFQSVNNSMETMEDLIKQDIDAKRKYFREETKILEKDSRNLTGIRAGFGRQLIAGALGAVGISQILKGNIGDGLAGVGGAAALLTPEILGVISTVVTTNLVKRGLLGRGAGVGTMGSRVAGASKLKNPLLITAALAASLILPGLVNSNQNADRRRQLSATRTIRGAETINKPDVDRFRTILARFDSILSSISLERKGRSQGTLDEQDVDEFLEGDKNKKDKKNDLEPEKDETDDTEEKGGFFEGFKNLFGIGKEEEINEEEGGGEGEGTDVSFIDDSIMMDLNQGDQNLFNENTLQSTNVAMGDINPNLATDFTANLGDLSFDMVNKNISNNVKEQGINDTIVDLSQEDSKTPPPSSGFSGLTAMADFVSVTTRFSSSAGAIDKIAFNSALNNGGSGL